MRYIFLLLTSTLIASRVVDLASIFDGDQGTKIAGCVDPRTGEYFIAESDLTASAMQPISLFRTYTSQTQGERQWSHAEVSRIDRQRNGTLVLYEYSGACARFRYKDGKFVFDESLVSQGWHHKPSNHPNFRGYTIEEKGEKYNVITSDGTRRTYTKGKFLFPEYNRDAYQYTLERELLPNRKHITYKSKGQTLAHIMSKTFLEDHTYEKITFQSHNDIQTTGSQAQQSVQYKYKTLHNNTYIPFAKTTKILSSITRNTTDAQESLHYYPISRNPKARRLLKERNFGEQRGHKVCYYIPKRAKETIPPDCEKVGDHCHYKNYVSEIQGRFFPHGDMKTLYKLIYKHQRTEDNRVQTAAHDAEGGCTEYSYDTLGRLSTIFYLHPKGGHNRSDYKWDKRGNLAKQITKNQQTQNLQETYYTYDKQGINLLEQKTTGNFTGDGKTTRSTRYAYSNDIYRNIVQKEDNLGNKENFTYYSESNLPTSHIISKNGTITSRTFTKYNNNGDPVHVIQDTGEFQNSKTLEGLAVRQKSIITYKNYLPVEIITQFYNKETGKYEQASTTRQAFNNRSQVTKKSITYSDGKTQTYSYKYDKAGNCIRSTDPLGRTTIARFNAWNECIYKKEGSKRYAKTTKYNLIGQIDHIELTSNDNQKRTEHYTYTPLSRLSSKTDHLGRKTTFSYNILGHVHKKTAPKTEDNFDNTTTYEYDTFGNPTLVTDPDGKTTQTTYTITGDIIETHPPTGPPTKNTYHLDGRLDTQTTGRKTLKYHYDHQSRLTKTEILENDTPVSYHEEKTYKNGLLHTYKKPGSPLITYTYDHQGRKKTESTGQYTKHFSYDPRGMCIQTTEYLQGKLLQTTKAAYDLAGRATQTQIYNHDNQLLQQKNITYDTCDNIICETIKTETGTNVTSWTYDGFGRVLTHTDAKGQTTQHIYKEAIKNGYPYLKELIISPRGEKKLITKNALEQIIKISHIAIDNTKLYQETKTYNNIGQLLTHTYTSPQHTLTIATQYNQNRLPILTTETYDDKEKHTTITYNQYCEITSKTKPSGTTLTYTYDILGNTLSSTSSDGTIADSFTYNYENQIISHSSKETLLPTTKTYSDSGYLIRENHGNGLTIQYTYNDIGQLTSQTNHRHPPIAYTYKGHLLKTVSYQTYTHTYDKYDLRGNLIQETTPFGEKITYTHNQLNQTTKTIGQHAQEHTPDYDESGNLLSQTITSQHRETTNSYTYNSQNQLTSEDSFLPYHYTYDPLQQVTSINDIPLTYKGTHLSTFGTNTYNYDTDGRRTRKNDITYTYDAYDRLTHIQSDNLTLHNIYDAENRLITQTKNGTTTNYLYDNQTEIASYQDDTLIDLRILGLGRSGATGAAILIFTQDTLFSVQNDIFGSILLLKNPNRTHRFAPTNAFGQNNTRTFWSYKSKRFDKDTGLYHFGNRFYDPETIQWLTPDPLGYQDAPNHYQFLRNNPFAYDDELGLSTMDIDEMYRVHPDINKFGQRSPQDLIGRDQYQNIPPNSHLYCPYEAKHGGMSSITDLQTATNSNEYMRTNIGKKPYVLASLNGIRTSYTRGIENALYLSEGMGRINIDIIHNHSHGTLNDLKESALNLFGYPTKPVLLLMEHAITNYKAGIKTIYSIHSQGAAIYLAAQSRLPKEVRDNMFVAAAAPAIRIPNEVCAKAHNILSRDDIVPRAGGLHATFGDTLLKSSLSEYLGSDSYTSLGKYTKNATYSGGFVPRKQIFVKDHIDHEFQSETYRDDLFKVLKKFTQEKNR